MTSARDVAAYILGRQGPMTAMKLQKLVYYSQAWHLVWEQRALFADRIEAWANGPVVRALYRMHRGRFTLAGPADVGGPPAGLTDAETSTIDAVLGAYGDESAHRLSELTHREDPWRQARERAGLSERERGDAVITTDAMFAYYDGLTRVEAEAV